MKYKEYISEWQMIAIIAGFTLGTSIIYCLSINFARRDAWLSEIAALLIGIVIISMTALISKTYPQKDLGEIFTCYLNKWIGKLLFFIFFFISFLLAAAIIKEYQIFMNLMVMQEIPSWLFITTLALTVGLLLYYGIEVFARCVEIVTPLILGTLCFLIIIENGFICIDNILPQFTESVLALFKAAETSLALPYFEIPLLLFIFVHLKKQEKALKTGIIGLLIGGVFLVLRPIYVVLIFGPESSEIFFPVYSIARQITLGEFLERIELLMLIVWFLTGIIKLGVFIFAGVKSLEYIFDLQDYKKIVLPYVVCLMPFALKAYANYQEVIQFIVGSLVMLEILFILLPLFYIFFVSRRVEKLKFHKLKEGGN